MMAQAKAKLKKNAIFLMTLFIFTAVFIFIMNIVQSDLEPKIGHNLCMLKDKGECFS